MGRLLNRKTNNCNFYFTIIKKKFHHSFSTQKEAHSEKIQTETDKKFFAQRIKILDKQIDTLVYELYDLSEAEISVVEGRV